MTSSARAVYKIQAIAGKQMISSSFLLTRVVGSLDVVQLKVDLSQLALPPS